MTYVEAIALKAAIEAALLTASTSGAVSVTHNGRSITYANRQQASANLAELNRSIQAYSRRSANRNPHVQSPIWR